MNITKMKLTLVSICGLMLVPFASHASTATMINDTTALFTIDFSFTDELFAVSVPIMAENNVAHNDRVNTVGYTLEADDSELTKISGIVLSTSNIEGNKYSLQKGETGNFTVLILATFAEELTDTQTARITKIPYWLGERRTTVHQNQLDDLSTSRLDL